MISSFFIPGIADPFVIADNLQNKIRKHDVSFCNGFGLFISNYWTVRKWGCIISVPMIKLKHLLLSLKTDNVAYILDSVKTIQITCRLCV